MFMEKAGQAVLPKPTLPDEETRRFRAMLILEGTIETINALGFAVKATAPGVYALEKMFEPNLVEIVDGCADISVVTRGTLSACGVADEDLLKEVDNNNLAKFGPGGFRREDGKWMKPPSHRPPDIAGVLTGQAR
jgi:predicted HAD superfamily Cof-like phosphohydrolase